MTNDPNETPERRDVIHRCYMTGQRCVYSQDLLSRPAKGGFSLSQFSGDFNHIWEFNLRSWMKGSIRRADVVARTGYVMCSRICHPIQESAVIVADVTTANLNVFYELGLACALGKRILILRHESLTPAHVTEFLNSVGLSDNTQRYSSADDDFNEEHVMHRCKPVTRFQNRHTGPRRNVLVFSNELKAYLWPAGQVQSVRSRATKISDIVTRALTGLTGDTIASRCQSMLLERGDSRRSVSVETVSNYVNVLRTSISRNAAMTASGSLLEGITASEMILIDTSLHDFETYFWLGLCHGLEKEVIPLSIADSHLKDPVLPFDIKTLWHVGGTFEHPDTIVSQLSQILVEIIAKSLTRDATAHRDRFWRPVFEAPKMRFYLGTATSGQLASKQVVGEWDLRTIQEVNSFVLRDHSNVDVVIERPVFRKEHYDVAEKLRFADFLRRTMHDAHCVVIGSADVNPAAELVLSRLKGVEAFKEWAQPDGREEAERHALPVNATVLGVPDSYVAFKNYLKERYSPGASSFYTQFESKDAKRGFIYFGHDGREKQRYEMSYIPRDEFGQYYSGSKDGILRWDLLGHVIVAPNPFASGYPNTRLRVILIMGVGGPATLGIAHLLTGHPPETVNVAWSPENVQEFFISSDKFLTNLNDLIERHGAAEGILDVKIVKGPSANDAYEDSRDIGMIKLAESLPGVANPKAFVYMDHGPGHMARTEHPAAAAGSRSTTVQSR